MNSQKCNWCKCIKCIDIDQKFFITLRKLLGTKYVFDVNTSKLDSNSPCFINRDITDENVLKEVKEQGVACVGLFNLMWRYIHKRDLPAIETFDSKLNGGTLYWDTIYSNQRANLVENLKHVKEGDLLMRPFNGIEDVGHVGIVSKLHLDENNEVVAFDHIHSSRIDGSVVEEKYQGSKQETLSPYKYVVNTWCCTDWCCQIS